MIEENIVYYWNDSGDLEELPIPSQEERAHALATMSRAQLNAYKEKYQLLKLKDKLYSPAEYPCACELQSPHQCAEGKRKDCCGCPCHSYWQGF